MSAPTTSSRPPQGRPTRPVQRTPVRPPARTTARTPQPRTTGTGSAPARAAGSTARTAGGTARAGGSTAARAGASTARSTAGVPGSPGRAASTGASSARAAARGLARGAAAATAGATALALPPLSDALPSAPAARTRVRVLERPRTGGRRVGFAVSCTAVLGALMLGLLLLNVAISGNAFTVAELQSQRSVLVDQQQALEQRLLLEGAPSSLAARARGLGMVPAPQVLVLAPDGTGAPPVAPAP